MDAPRAGMSVATAGTEAPQARGVGLVERLREMAVSGLPRMLDAERGLFVFRVRRTADGFRREGLSPRYTAITAIGLAGEDEATVRAVLGSTSPRELCGRLLAQVGEMRNLGDVALTLWASRAVGHPDAGRAQERLALMRPEQPPQYCVELAWALSALSLDASGAAGELRERVARALLGSWNRTSGLFPHVVGGSGLRAHVSCFADLVYPVQALSLYFKAAGDAAALAAARACAERFCELQGADGQWWWHYDYRTGRVVEGYPVYAVHQDAMAPMALFALEAAGGGRYEESIRRGLAWLESSPELRGGSLIDVKAGFIWRKVARREPGRLSRYAQALSSALHPALRAPGLDAVFPPGAVDDEDRPYHLGWLLHAFPPSRARAW